jgi:hypothetical protein
MKGAFKVTNTSLNTNQKGNYSRNFKKGNYSRNFKKGNYSRNFLKLIHHMVPHVIP